MLTDIRSHIRVSGVNDDIVFRLFKKVTKFSLKYKIKIVDVYILIVVGKINRVGLSRFGGCYVPADLTSVTHQTLLPTETVRRRLVVLRELELIDRVGKGYFIFNWSAWEEAARLIEEEPTHAKS